MSEGNDDNWKMPKPVFRSSTGALPKSFEETINQSFSPDTDTVEIDEDDDVLGVIEPRVESEDVIIRDVDPADPDAAAKAQQAAIAEDEPKGAVYRSFSGTFLLLAALALLAAVALIYFFGQRAGSE